MPPVARHIFAEPLFFARELFHDIASLIAPDDCRLCNEPLLEVQTAPVCNACLQGITPQHTALCSRCGESMGFEFRTPRDGSEAWLCHICRMAEPPFVHAAAYGLYDGALREAIHLLKFEHVLALASKLAPFLAETIGSLAAEAPAEMTVVAVPLYKRKRPFNQSVALADAALPLVRRAHPAWKLRVDHGLLKRVRRTESQFQLTTRQRRLNLRGAFAVPDTAAVKDRHILLVDDIYTTGATARECSRVLLRAGAASVYVATLARAQRLSAEQWSPAVQLKSSHPPSRTESPA